MYSPVRICHPVSPSASKTLQPLPAAKTQSRTARNRQSESDGMSSKGTLRTVTVPVWTAGISMSSHGTKEVRQLG